MKFSFGIFSPSKQQIDESIRGGLLRRIEQILKWPDLQQTMW